MDDTALSKLFFFLTVAMTLAITVWAARRTHDREEFYTAGHRISGRQNGLAIAGDFLSAATFLGIVGLIYSHGFDAIIYILSPLAGLALILSLFAGPLRRLGRYTMADVLAVRFPGGAMRAFAALSTLAVSLFYLVAQVVGAGSLIEVLFGIRYTLAVPVVGALMVFYVALGGMLATTWVQIVKAVLLIAGTTALAVLALAAHGFSLGDLYAQAAATHPQGRAIFAPGGLFEDPATALSLAAGLVFGLAGLPHLMIRFFTVPDEREAQRSALWGAGFVSFVFVLIFFIIGYATIVHIRPAAEFHQGASLIGGANMAAIHLARALGGPIFFGVISAIAFATILAVVAGLTLACAGAVAHDLIASLIRHGSLSDVAELRISRLTTLGVGAVAIVAGLAFEGENIAYMIALAFTIAAGANFPLLLLTIHWAGLTARGALWGGAAGLASALVLVIAGPGVWVKALGNAVPLVDITYPAPIAILVSFTVLIGVSRLDREGRARAKADYARMRARLASS